MRKRAARKFERDQKMEEMKLNVPKSTLMQGLGGRGGELVCVQCTLCMQKIAYSSVVCEIREDGLGNRHPCEKNRNVSIQNKQCETVMQPILLDDQRCTQKTCRLTGRCTR